MKPKGILFGAPMKPTTYQFRYADGQEATVTTTDPQADPWALSRLAAQSAGIKAGTESWISEIPEGV